jgi:large subunit ribosomal protein L9
MRSVKVILRQDIETLGSTGEIVGVKPGYARNYLLPRGYAYEATRANLRQLEEDRSRAESRAKRDYLEARRRASKLEGMSLTFHAKAGEESKLFGSITSGDIADRVREQGIDFELDRRWIELDEPIKALGETAVPVRLHPEVTADLRVNVLRDA